MRRLHAVGNGERHDNPITGTVANRVAVTGAGLDVWRCTMDVVGECEKSESNVAGTASSRLVVNGTMRDV